MDSAQGVGRLPDECLDRFCVQCVHDEGNDLASRFLSNLRGSLAERRLSPGADRNIATLPGQLPRCRFAHAKATTGDDCLFALQLKIHAPSFEERLLMLFDVRHTKVYPSKSCSCSHIPSPSAKLT